MPTPHAPRRRVKRYARSYRTLRLLPLVVCLGISSCFSMKPEAPATPLEQPLDEVPENLLQRCVRRAGLLIADGPDGSASLLALLDWNVTDVLDDDDCADGKDSLISAYIEYRDAVRARETRRAQPAPVTKRWWWER
jgi:hypothetical protein